MHLAAPGYTLAAFVAVLVAAGAFNVRHFGVRLVVWHGYDAGAAVLPNPRRPKGDEDWTAFTRTLTAAGALAVAWILVVAATAPNLAHAPLPAWSSSGMSLDAPGYCLLVAPVALALAWFASRGETRRPALVALQAISWLALLWIVVSAAASHA